MRKMSFCILVASLLAASCQQKETAKEFAVDQLQDKRCFVIIGNEPFHPAGNVIGLENSYNVAWPKAGQLTPEAERELLVRTFGDSTSTTFEEAAGQLLYLTWDYELEGIEIQLLELKSDSIADTLQYTYGHLESNCTVNGNVASFNIKDEIFVVGSAHGTYTAQYVNIDVAKGTVIHIEDLMDTVKLSKAIRLALDEIEDNTEVLGCLFEECLGADRLPVPVDFVVDSTFSTLSVVYQLYEIAPYACGIQSVVLPIEWLTRHVPFTPYGREIFGLSKAGAMAESK